MKLLLRASFGSGTDGTDLALAFRQAGCDVHLEPLDVYPPLPLDVAELLAKRPTAPFDLRLHLADPRWLGLDPEERAAASINVAHTRWPTTTVDNLPGRPKLKRALKSYDLVIGDDQVTTGALAPYVTTNAATVQAGVWPPEQQPYRDWNTDTLRFMAVDNNPFVVQAFQELRDEDPGFVATLNIRPPSVEAYAAHHVLILPETTNSRAALGMLATGGVVIATSWGGNAQWLASNYGYRLDYTLEPITSSVPVCVRAVPVKDHLKQLILRAVRRRDELARMSDSAASLIPTMCAWPKVVDRLMDRIGEISETGERVLHRYRVAKARAEETRTVLL